MQKGNGAVHIPSTYASNLRRMPAQKLSYAEAVTRNVGGEKGYNHGSYSNGGHKLASVSMVDNHLFFIKVAEEVGEVAVCNSCKGTDVTRFQKRRDKESFVEETIFSGHSKCSGKGTEGPSQSIGSGDPMFNINSALENWRKKTPCMEKLKSHHQKKLQRRKPTRQRYRDKKEKGDNMISAAMTKK
ncbi:hypothetical protein Ancab_000594 [Ancistrocladus abbreviatus]